MFFSPKDKASAVGMYSITYFIMLFISIVLIVVGLLLSRKMNHKQVKTANNAVCIFMWVTEIIKMIFYGLTYGFDSVEFFPLYYCSMFMYALIMINFKNEKIKNAAMSYMSFGGVLGAIFFFCYPSSVIPNYHAFHFMSIRTMLFHASMIYIGLLNLVTHFYIPKHKHFINYSIFFLVVFILAYVNNLITGDNLMYISKPLPIKIVKDLYNAIPNLYPFIAGFLNLIVPYGLSYGIYLLINKFLNKNNNI